MPPTNVEIIKPTVTDIMPALVKSVEIGTPKIPSVRKDITTAANPKSKKWSIVAA